MKALTIRHGDFNMVQGTPASESRLLRLRQKTGGIVPARYHIVPLENDRQGEGMTVSPGLLVCYFPPGLPGEYCSWWAFIFSWNSLCELQPLKR